MNHISSVVLDKQNTNNSKTIVNSSLNKTINNSNNSYVVNQLLKEYDYLIQPSHKSWFAVRFYNLPLSEIHEVAGKARNKARDPKRYFAKAISVMYQKAGATKGVGTFE